MYELSKENIQKLSDLVNQLEQFSGEWNEEIPGTLYSSTNELALKARRFLIRNKLFIYFNWPEWDEGKIFFRNNDPQKYENLDKEFILKFLSAIARYDRFSNGAWGNLFESGTAIILYKKLLELYKNDM